MSLSADIIAALRLELSQPNPRSRAQMAADLGVTKNVVVGALNRAGVRTGASSKIIRDRLDAQRDRIVALAEMGACAAAIAAEMGVHADTLRRFAAANAIAIRVHTPSLRNAGARRALGGTLGKRRPLAPRDRAEMDRLRDEALAAGKITRLPPGHAYGALKWTRSEYSA